MDINKQIQESSIFNSTQIMVKTDKPEIHKNLPLSNNASIYKKINHFHNLIETANDFPKYTEEQYHADLQKWSSDASYTKGQINWTEKYAHLFKQWSGEINENKTIIMSATPINTEKLDITVRKELIMSATSINTENTDITEIIKNIQLK